LQRLTPRPRSHCSTRSPTSHSSLRFCHASGRFLPEAAAWSALSTSCVIFVSPRHRQRSPSPSTASFPGLPCSPPTPTLNPKSFDRHTAYRFCFAFQSVVWRTGIGAQTESRRAGGHARCRRLRC
ncbi:hypothetical protein DFH11DRAFT_1863239, partial [Phellopilus nigrolimitatus]